MDGAACVPTHVARTRSDVVAGSRLKESPIEAGIIDPAAAAAVTSVAPSPVPSSAAKYWSPPPRAGCAPGRGAPTMYRSEGVLPYGSSSSGTLPGAKKVTGEVALYLVADLA